MDDDPNDPRIKLDVCNGTHAFPLFLFFVVAYFPMTKKQARQNLGSIIL